MQGAVGDILSHFYDEDGKVIETEILDRLISSNVEMLKTVKM